MAKQTKAQREWQPGQPKKPRSVKVMFASTVLFLEAFVVFFATLVAYGLAPFDVPPGLLLGIGIGLSAAMIITCAFLTKPIGYPLGWLLQLALIATGFVVSMMFLIGALFALTWWYGLRTGARLDRETAARQREQLAWEQEHPDAGPQQP